MITTENTVYRLTATTSLLMVCCLLWFLPLTHDVCQNIDTQTAIWLNNSVDSSRPWQLLWGYLNHQNENWLNVLFMMGLNVIGIYALPKKQRPQATVLVLYFWLFFQIVLLMTHLIFSDWLHVERGSPSLVITPWILLTDVLNMDNIKVYSERSFPAGHILVLVFWAQFTMLYGVKWIRRVAIATVLVLTLPRLISGAHWLSDILFTAVYGTLWFYLAQATFIFKKIMNIRVKNEKSIH